MQTVTVRKDNESGELILFYVVFSRNGEMIELKGLAKKGYSLQFIQPDLDYYRKCSPVSPDSQEAKELFDDWQFLPYGSGEGFRLGKKLFYKKRQQKEQFPRPIVWNGDKWECSNGKMFSYFPDAKKYQEGLDTTP